MEKLLTKYIAWSLYGLIIALYIFSLWTLLDYHNAQTYRDWRETAQILKYSLWQAGLSAVLSLLFGTLLARSFFYLQFRGKALLYRMISFTWALPSLVVIFAIIGVWGNSGWLAQTLSLLGLDWQPQLYGLQGIIIAHLFFNVPLAAKYGLSALQLIPSSQHQLAAQLHLHGWHYFRIVELPSLKKVLPYAFSTIFLICFTSFPIVLMLGGGPKYSTLEVAIYQAVTFEFDFAKAFILIVVQLAIGLILQLLMLRIGKAAFSHTHNGAVVVDKIWLPKPQGIGKYGLQASLGLLALLTILPLLNVISNAVFVSHFFTRLANPQLWQAAFYSILLSVVASLSVVIIAYSIALEARKLAYQQKRFQYNMLVAGTLYPLIFPIFLLAVGLFLLLIEIELSNTELLVLIGFCNGLTLLPYIYHLLYPPMWEALTAQDKLAKSLGLQGFTRWWIVEKGYLLKPLRNAFALAMSASLGSFAVIAFFGSPDFSTLPYLLYQQLGSYRTEDAAVTALVLMLFALLPFLFIEQPENRQ